MTDQTTRDILEHARCASVDWDTLSLTAVLEALQDVPQYGCDDPDCPGQPDWAKDRAAMTEELLVEGDRLVREALGTLAERIDAAVEDHYRKHPDQRPARAA